MEWQMCIHKEEGYGEVITKGFADHESSITMAKDIMQYMRKNKVRRILIDHRLIDGISGSTVEIYRRPAIFRLIGVLMNIRIAEVVDPKYINHFRFFETVCVNQGFQFSVFQDPTIALEWLLKT